MGFLVMNGNAFAGGLPCEGRINVLLDVWGVGTLKAGSILKSGEKTVKCEGHDSPSAKQITLLYSKSGQKNMRVVVDKASCLLSSAEVYVDGPNPLKTPAKVDLNACREIFEVQQGTPYRSNPSRQVFDEFQENILKKAIPNWGAIKDPDVRHAYKARFIPNCGQTPANAGPVRDRIGALGYLSWSESQLAKYFSKKDADRRGEGLKDLEKAPSGSQKGN
ncbi:MAG: hypothetical protein EBX52_04310 [Proteobacteria bacterium]|nr:hypothetical protein [Pseudomonadota bacterium]